MPPQPENELQYMCIEYLRKVGRPGLVYHHSPNELCTQKKHRIHQWRMGMLAGWPDLIILMDGLDSHGSPSVSGGFVEFKIGHQSLSDDQFELKHLLENMGFDYRVIRSFDAFMALCADWNLVR